jgi:hypothetical protein
MEGEMGLAGITHGKDKKFKQIALEKPKGNRHFGNLGCRWQEK